MIVECRISEAQLSAEGTGEGVRLVGHLTGKVEICTANE